MVRQVYKHIRIHDITKEFYVHGISFGDKENLNELINTELKVLIEKLEKFRKRHIRHLTWKKIWKNQR